MEYIWSEHEKEEDLLSQESGGAWVINAVAHVDELEAIFGVKFEERDFDTVGGLVISGFGRVPVKGESIELRGLRIEVLQADQRRVHKLRVRPVEGEGDDESRP